MTQAELHLYPYVCLHTEQDASMQLPFIARSQLPNIMWKTGAIPRVPSVWDTCMLPYAMQGCPEAPPPLNVGNAVVDHTSAIRFY